LNLFWSFFDFHPARYLGILGKQHHRGKQHHHHHFFLLTFFFECEPTQTTTKTGKKSDKKSQNNIDAQTDSLCLKTSMAPACVQSEKTRIKTTNFHFSGTI
jgi:hypothetical protein